MKTIIGYILLFVGIILKLDNVSFASIFIFGASCATFFWAIYESNKNNYEK